MTKRQRRVFEGNGLAVQLTYYGPATQMAPHSHDYHQVSFLLAGAIAERHGGRERVADQPSVGVKPAGLDHGNGYGRDGALILAVNLDPGRAEASAFGGDWDWSPGSAGVSPVPLIALIRDGGRDAEAAVWDLLAVSQRRHRNHGPVPGWLDRVRDRLGDPDDDAGIAEMAREADIHRVHLSRCFTGHFSIPPSLYRVRCRVARAMGAIARGASLSAAAAEAGFADQAHLSRQIKRETGYTPSRFRDLLAAA
jgi:AraC family transcriptional regulator